MSNYSQEELSYFWREGKNLWDALCAFCDRDIWKEYPKYSNTNNIHEDFAKKNPWATIFDQLGGLAEYESKRSNALDKLKKDLYRKIHNGELIAVGAKIASELPSQIPLHMWPPKEMSLKDSSISGKGFEFVEVRIIAKNALPKLAPPKIVAPPILKDIKPAPPKLMPPNIPVARQKVGRQTLKEEIIFAYEFLKEHERIDYSKALKSHTTLIQKVVQEKYGIEGTAGMQFEAIRRAVGDRFKRNRESSKKALNSN